MVFKVRRISPATFGFILFCFLLPFVTLSCPGGQFTFSGTQLALGTTIQQPDMFGQKGEEKKIQPEPLALLAFLCAVGGVAAGFLLPLRKGRWSGVILGCLVVLFLLLLRGKVNGDAVKQGEGMFQVSFGIGYWLALLTSFVAVAFNAALGKAISFEADPPPAHPAIPLPPIRPGS